MTNQIIVGGIEGGGTHSTLLLADVNGNILTTVDGPQTNHWQIGMPECQKRIAQMVTEAKEEAGIPESQPLSALGLCLSGCEQEESNDLISNGMKVTYPNVAEKYVVCSDTDGSVATVAASGGIVMISGTGSNCLLINPDGSRFQCGGWGHLLGDEGSAFSISQRAIKVIYDDHDGFRKPPHPTDWVWQTIKEHFNIETRKDLLDYLYSNFRKDKIAGLCRKLAEGALAGEKLCIHLFEEAGEVLAEVLLAQVPRAAPELKDRPGGLQVLCVGSVWKSWSLMEPGFVSVVRHNCCLQELSLTRLTTTSALGAAYLAADKYNYPIPKTYDDNHNVFYHYKK